MTDETIDTVQTIEIPGSPEIPGESLQSAPAESVLLLNVEDIRPDPRNVRRIKPSQEDVNRLFASVAEIGVRFPIIVRHDESDSKTHYVIVAGEGRWRAAISARHAVVPAIVRELDEAQTAVDQIVENVVRKDLHPVDNWKSMKRLIEKGYSSDGAAAIMGLSYRQGQRLLKLGNLHPDILDKISKSQNIPSWDLISVIASAPHDIQAKALNRFEQGEWFGVAEACRQRRIPVTLAIFDTATDVEFEEDLFASPDDPERFTTTNIDGFLAAQRKALADRAANSKGKIVVLTPKAGAPDASLPLPTGWVSEFGDIPAKWKRTDKRKVFAYVVQGGYHVGKVVEILARPIEEAPPKAHATEDKTAQSPATDDQHADSENEDESEGGDSTGDDAPVARDQIRKAGQHLLSKAKRAAIGTALDRRLESDPHPNVAQFVVPLLLAISGKNVWVDGSPDMAQRKVSFDDLTADIVSSNGTVFWDALDDIELCRLMAEYIKRMVVFPSPGAFNSSGPAAEWIGRALNAEEAMPRLDTAEMLNTCSHALLKDIALGAKVTGGTAKELKDRLAGHAPHWNPVTFGAPGPEGHSQNVSGKEDDEQYEQNASPF